MFQLFRRDRGNDVMSGIEGYRPDHATNTVNIDGTETAESAFTDEEYERIFDPLTLGDLEAKSAQELAILAGETFAAAEDSALREDYDAEIAADFARAAALGNLALLKQAGLYPTPPDSV